MKDHELRKEVEKLKEEMGIDVGNEVLAKSHHTAARSYREAYEKSLPKNRFFKLERDMGYKPNPSWMAEPFQTPADRFKYLENCLTEKNRQISMLLEHLKLEEVTDPERTYYRKKK